MDVPGLLRAARRDLGVSQRALAVRLGIAPSSLSRFESGAAALHGLPHEHDHARLWYSGDETGIVGLASLLRERIAFLDVDGHPTSPEIRPSTLVRHPEAEWVLRLVGPFSTAAVPPGGPCPAEVRLEDAELGPLRVVLPTDLGPVDGARPELLARWRALRSAA